MGAVQRDLDQLVEELNELEVARAGTVEFELDNPCRFTEVAGTFDPIPGAQVDLRTGWMLAPVT